MNNKHRKLCRTCQYRNAESSWTQTGRCNYIGVTRHMRGCPAGDCDKYVKGKRLPTFGEVEE